ncbi:ParB N-terminal domain-containing protein, partial [Rhodococcus hoagii]|nr:ParB N-terminal domain-containing protein [Prescottella equi]
ATLEIGDNVRDEVDLDATPEFVESIAEHGVLHPILAERRNDGTILVTDGQRRLLAARAANRTSVPVIIRPQENGTENARKAARIGQQIVSNDQREALTDGQRAAGIAAMLDLGLSRPPSPRQPASPRQGQDPRDGRRIEGRSSQRGRAPVHHRTGRDHRRVRGSRRHRGHQPPALLRQPLPVRLHGRAPPARPGGTHRPRRRGRTVRGQGLHHPRRLQLPPVTFEHVLTDAGEPITLETVEADASRWGVRLSWTEAWFDRQSGAEVTEDEIDWGTHENPDLEAEDGLLHMNNIETRRVWDREFHLLDPGNLEGSGLQLSDVAKLWSRAGPDALPQCRRPPKKQPPRSRRSARNAAASGS